MGDMILGMQRNVSLLHRCDLLPEGHYQNCNDENTTYLYYFTGNVTIVLTWELAF